LGDVVGYGAQPGECIDLLQSFHVTNILGNHDSYITRNENCPRSRVVSQIIEYQRAVLSSNQVNWLRNSLDFLRKEELLFVHGGPDDPCDQYLYTVSRNTVPDGVRWLFSGHTHVQLLVDFNGLGYCNPGSVGQPRDGDSRAAYAILDGETVQLHRIAYDIDRTVAAMKAAGFEPFCYENLYQGAQIGGRVDTINIVLP
jgi:diadenosine tetraphosphatase ApaH/serine/threonine PP2A family protein phosphatase